MSTVLYIHLAFITISFGLASFTLFSPSFSKITYSYLSYAGIVVSGTVLTIINPASLLKSCLFGLITLSVLIGMSSLAKRKLVA